MENIIDLPSLHIMGSDNKVVSMEESNRLTRRFIEPTVITHQGGHCLPHTPEIMKGIEAFLTFVGREIGGSHRRVASANCVRAPLFLPHAAPFQPPPTHTTHTHSNEHPRQPAPPAIPPFKPDVLRHVLTERVRVCQPP